MTEASYVPAQSVRRGDRIKIMHVAPRGHPVSNQGHTGVVCKPNGLSVLVELDDGRVVWTRRRYLEVQIDGRPAELSA